MVFIGNLNGRNTPSGGLLSFSSIVAVASIFGFAVSLLFSVAIEGRGTVPLIAISIEPKVLGVLVVSRFPVKTIFPVSATIGVKGSPTTGAVGCAVTSIFVFGGAVGCAVTSIFVFGGAVGCAVTSIFVFGGAVASRIRILEDGGGGGGGGSQKAGRARTYAKAYIKVKQKRQNLKNLP
jgi:hypothetical protein